MRQGAGRQAVAPRETADICDKSVAQRPTKVFIDIFPTFSLAIMAGGAFLAREIK
jgi:hypothetical protein